MNIPIPYLATIGAIIEAISYVFMSALPTMTGSIIASSVLWVGFCLASPTSVSIISVCLVVTGHR